MSRTISPEIRRVVSVILLVFLCLCGLVTEVGAAANVRTIKVGIAHAPGHSFCKAMEVFAELVADRSGGELKVEIYPSSQLGGEREMQEMVSLGTLEMTVTGVIVVYEPLFALLEAPYLYRDRDHVLKVMESSVVDDLGKSLKAKNIRMVGFYENGWRNITNNRKPINAPADVKGLKIRTPENEAQIATFRELGAIPTPMAFSELYTALQQGVVDGQENPLQNIWDGKFYEVQKHCAMTGHIYNAAYIIANDKFWGSLPENLKKIADESLRESVIWQLDYVRDLDERLVGDLQAQGVQITYPDKALFREATRGVYDAFYKKWGDRAKNLVETILAL